MTDDHGVEDLVIQRSFDAPTDLIWQMWTEPEHFAAWYGPAGATITVAEMDVRVGGRRLLCMEMPTPDGPMQMWFTGEYLEVDVNRLLVYTDSMSDEHGNAKTPEQMGMPAGHPTITEVRVELEQTDSGTSMVLTHVGVAAGSPGAAGWAMAVDKLSARVGETQRSG